mgnify:CR=1 FL=1
MLMAGPAQSPKTGGWKIFIGLAVAGLAQTAAPIAQAQEKWPSRRVTLVVPFGAGTVTDAMGRLIADQLQSMFAQPFIVENRAGAGGMLGAGSVAKADPDGYTLLLGGNTTHSAVRALFKNVPYDPLADFTPPFLVDVSGPFRTPMARTLRKRWKRRLASNRWNSSRRTTRSPSLPRPMKF